MKAGRLAGFEWDAVAGVVAAVAAIVLHTLHVVENDVLLAVMVAILALLLLRDLRREAREARLLDLVSGARASLAHYEAALSLPEAQVIGPGRLRAESARFAAEAAGQVTYFNVCLLMFRPQALFDQLLRPAVENPRVTSVLFVLDHGERTHWEQHVAPKIARCAGSTKVLEPHWCDLDESVSFIVADRETSGKAEALVSFWGEPFMSSATEQQVPRYIFRIHAHSDLVGRLVELERKYRLLPG